MAEPLYLITLFPLLGFLANGLLGRWLSERQSGLLASMAVLGSLLVSGSLFFSLLAQSPHERLFTQILFDWIPVGDLHVRVTYLFDPLAASNRTNTLMAVLNVWPVRCAPRLVRHTASTSSPRQHPGMMGKSAIL